MITTTGTATVKVIARPKNQCIDVSIDRGNWYKGFQIKIVDGVLPEKYRGDPQIEAAYRLVLAQHCKWQNMESERRAKEGDERESAKKMEMEQRSKQFVEGLDPEALLVGDGSDHLPVWIGIDAESGKVFKIYATGLAQGFGDGRMTIINGMSPDRWHVKRGEQVSSGKNLMLSQEDGAYGSGSMTVYEASPDPIFKNNPGL